MTLAELFRARSRARQHLRRARPRGRRVLLEGLEPRLLLSADPAGLILDEVLAPPGAALSVEGAPTVLTDSLPTADPGATPIDINPGPSSSSPGEPVRFNGALYFQADGGDGRGNELWRFDGTTATRITDLNPGAAGSFPSRLIVFKDALYFRASDGGAAGGGAGTELWRYDGTSIALVADISPGPTSSGPTGLTVFNDVLYFTADDAGQFTNGFGNELRWYDGTTLGVVDLTPGHFNSSPSSLTVGPDALYFIAHGPSVSFALWRYDGVNAVPVARIPATSTPGQLTLAGGFL